MAQEKDKKTLILLLLTRLSNSELVLGKLLASMLNVLVMIAAAIPLFMLLAMLGGVSYSQILRVFAVTFASSLVAGSVGSAVALWREKTFQALALTALILVLWLGVGEVVATGLFGREWFGVAVEQIAVAVSPWRAILAATQPTVAAAGGGIEAWFGIGPDGGARLLAAPGIAFTLVAAILAAAINAVAIAMVRVWNPSRDVLPTRAAETTGGLNEALTGRFTSTSPETLSAGDAGGVEPLELERGQTTSGRTSRSVWDNPVLWREICTWAYGKKVVLVRLGYWGLFAMSLAAIWAIAQGTFGELDARSLVPLAAQPIVPLLVVSLLLVNALAVTSLTTERDGKALDLLLVTDLTPKEFVYGKLGGVLFNAKEMIILPLALCLYLRYAGLIGTLNLVYLLAGLGVVYAFVAVLGVHAGMTYANSRVAIGVSLGTLMFLLLGIATCMRMMVAFRGSFMLQLPAFAGFMIGGGVGLFAALGWRNPSRAILIASFLAPFCTFFVITSFLLKNYGAMFLATGFVYGVATAAMLVPAVSEFDVATGRTTGGDD